MAGAGVENESARLLGAELRNRRISRGLSLRALARQVGLSGHGTLVDYEHGRRIPPEDLVQACEKALDIRDGYLRNLREKALAERADHASALLLKAPAEAEPTERAEPADQQVEEEFAEPDSPSRKPSRRLLVGTVLALALVGVALSGFVGVQKRQEGVVARPSVRMGFESEASRWWVLYGSQVAKANITGSIAFEGRHALMVRVTGSSATKGYSAVGISHGLDSLHPGMKVTAHLWVPRQEHGGVAFLVHDSHGKNHWSPENQSGGDQETENPLPTRPGWSKFTWTVPDVDRVTTIGIQIWSEGDLPLTLGVDAVGW